MSYLDGLALGKDVIYHSQYDADVLCPISRLGTRENLGINSDNLPFKGVDIWNAYEVSWLNLKGLPQVASAVFSFPCDSDAIIESKSFKLYLNTFNLSRFADIQAVRALMMRDLSVRVNAPVSVELYEPQAWHFENTARDQGLCIDQQDIAIDEYNPNASLLSLESDGIVEETLISHLLRSLCPVTGQPDWGSVSIHYKGSRLCHAGLLRYIVSYREHQEFHEQCVERIFTDLTRLFDFESLTVFARYVRRGGLDINPYRSTVEADWVNTRWYRQ